VQIDLFQEKVRLSDDRIGQVVATNCSGLVMCSNLSARGDKRFKGYQRVL